MLADIFDCNVKTITSKEGPCLGVAILAGVGAGVYASVENGCDIVIKNKEVQNPDKKSTEEYEKYYTIYKKIYPNLKNVYGELSRI